MNISDFAKGGDVSMGDKYLCLKDDKIYVQKSGPWTWIKAKLSLVIGTRLTGNYDLPTIIQSEAFKKFAATDEAKKIAEPLEKKLVKYFNKRNDADLDKKCGAIFQQMTGPSVQKSAPSPKSPARGSAEISNPFQEKGAASTQNLKATSQEEIPTTKKAEDIQKSPQSATQESIKTEDPISSRVAPFNVVPIHEKTDEEINAEFKERIRKLPAEVHIHPHDISEYGIEVNERFIKYALPQDLDQYVDSKTTFHHQLTEKRKERFDSSIGQETIDLGSPLYLRLDIELENPKDLKKYLSVIGDDENRKELLQKLPSEDLKILASQVKELGIKDQFVLEIAEFYKKNLQNEIDDTLKHRTQ